MWAVFSVSPAAQVFCRAFVGLDFALVGRAFNGPTSSSPLKWVTDWNALSSRPLRPLSPRELAASLSAELCADKQSPDHARVGPAHALRATLFSCGSLLLCEELYLRRQLYELAFNAPLPWLVALQQGSIALDLDGTDEPLLMRPGSSSLVLASSQNQQFTVLSAPARLIRLRFDPHSEWSQSRFVSSAPLPLLQPMLHLLRDSQRLDPASQTTSSLSVALQRYLFDVLAPSGVQLVSKPSDPLQVLLEWLPSHLDDELRVADLAAAACVSPRRLQELCHERFGCTPMELLRQQRLDALHSDLSAPPDRFAGIAQLFKRWRLPDSSATRSAFASRFGHTTSELRRRFLTSRG